MISEVRIAADTMKDAGFPELSDGLLRLVEEMEQTQAVSIELMERIHALEERKLPSPDPFNARPSPPNDEAPIAVPLSLVKWACGLLMIVNAQTRQFTEQDRTNLRRLRKCAVVG